MIHIWPETSFKSLYETFAKFLNDKMSFQVIHSDTGIYVFTTGGNIE